MERESLGVLAEPRMRFESDWLVSRQELEMLLQESETEKERGYRNLFGGIAACGAFGTFSTVAAHFNQVLETGMHPLESIFLILMIAAAMASGALAAFFHQRVRQAESGRSRRFLPGNLSEQLESAPDPADPRQWP